MEIMRTETERQLDGIFLYIPKKYRSLNFKSSISLSFNSLFLWVFIYCGWVGKNSGKREKYLKSFILRERENNPQTLSLSLILFLTCPPNQWGSFFQLESHMTQCSHKDKLLGCYCLDSVEIEITLATGYHFLRRFYIFNGKTIHHPFGNQHMFELEFRVDLVYTHTHKHTQEKHNWKREGKKMRLSFFDCCFIWRQKTLFNISHTGCIRKSL